MSNAGRKKEIKGELRRWRREEREEEYKRRKREYKELCERKNREE